MTWFMDNNSRVAAKSSHRVLMQFMSRKGWHISFLEEDCRTPLPLRLTFADPGKIFEMQQRWGEDRTVAAVSKLQGDITIGRPGGVWLLLTPEEYGKLKR